MPINPREEKKSVADAVTEKKRALLRDCDLIGR